MEQFFKDFAVAISPALQTLLQAVFIAAIGTLTAWLKSKYDVSKVKLSSEQQYLLELIVSSAVRAAEQVMIDGTEKREYAFEVAEKALKNYGVSIDIDTIYAEIEAQVFSKFSETPEG